MLRNEVEKITGLSRKAIEYYEERGFIKPERSSNGYRTYSQSDLNDLERISIYRKLGLTLSEIAAINENSSVYLSSILRKKEYKLESDGRKQALLRKLTDGCDINLVKEELLILEREESVYDKLERAFPGYFGQMLFISYKPFLNESLDEDGKEAFEEYVNFVDNMPDLPLSEEEKDLIENVSSNFSINDLEDINEQKLFAVNNPDKWFEANKENISKYESLKNTEAYKNNPVKLVMDKMGKYLEENGYYDRAIPLIRRFSKIYNSYYEKLLSANDRYLERSKDL